MRGSVPPRLPFIARWEIPARNAWSKSRKALEFSSGGLSFELALASASGAASWSPASYIRFLAGDTTVAVGVPQHLIEAVLESFGLRHGHLSEEIVLLLIEQRFSAALDAVERTIGESIESGGLSLRNPLEGKPHVRLDAWLGLWSNDYRISFYLTLDSAPKLTADLDRAAPLLYRRHDATVTAAFRVGATRLTLAKLKTIELNDVILADQTAGDGLVTVLVGGAYKANARYETGKAVLLEPLSRMAGHEGKRGGMPNGGTGGNAPDAGFNDLEIKIVFEVGRAELRLEELGALGTGHVFDLGKDARTAVDIYAGDRRIGFGEIVQINETLGVRVTRLFNNE
jgi:type III secretion system YscQ/HrcQ family protein